MKIFKLLKVIICLTLLTNLTSCFPPNGYFDLTKESKCIYFNPLTNTISKKCLDKKDLIFSSLLITITDTSYNEVEKRKGYYKQITKDIVTDFPLNIDSLIEPAYKNKEFFIQLLSPNKKYSCIILLSKKDWELKKELPFDFCYPR